eukprot:440744-Pleurochrysis_carterae.AAC.3
MVLRAGVRSTCSLYKYSVVLDITAAEASKMLVKSASSNSFTAVNMFVKFRHPHVTPKVSTDERILDVKKRRFPRARESITRASDLQPIQIAVQPVGQS